MLKKIIDYTYGDYHFEDEQGNWQSEYVRFRSNEDMMYKRYYKDNKAHGICTWYKENGEIDYKEYYWNGVEISKKEYFQNILKELKI